MIYAALALYHLIAMAAAVLLWRYRETRTELAAVRADRDRLHNFVEHNARAIRSRVGHYSPEAAAVCDALQSCLQARCRVDFQRLELELATLRRKQNAALLDAAGHKPALLEVTEHGCRVVNELPEGGAR